MNTDITGTPAAAHAAAPAPATLTAVLRRAGARLLRRTSTEFRPSTLADLVAAVRANDAAVADLLRPALAEIHPDARWLDDEHGSGPLPDGDWWLVDPVGGNMNVVQGMTDFNIGVSLVRDGRPVLAALHFPLVDELYTATEGGGAFLNGVRLSVSAKTSLDGALAGTGQAQPGQGPELADRVGASYSAMARHALYVRISVPVTHQLAMVAAGRMDLHWQHDNVRAHASGVLLVREAGGVVTDLDGKPWTLTSREYLAAAPGVHAEALALL